MLNMGQPVRNPGPGRRPHPSFGPRTWQRYRNRFYWYPSGEKLSEDLWETAWNIKRPPIPKSRAEAEEAVIPHDLDKIVDECQPFGPGGGGSAVIHLLDETIPDGKFGPRRQ